MLKFFDKLKFLFYFQVTNEKCKKQVADLDNQLRQIQTNSVKIGGEFVKSKEPTKIKPAISKPEPDMDSLVSDMNVCKPGK